jgi:hypothetical protein
MKILLNILATVISGVALAFIIAQCKEIKETRDAVIEMKAKQK